MEQGLRCSSRKAVRDPGLEAESAKGVMKFLFRESSAESELAARKGCYSCKADFFARPDRRLPRCCCYWVTAISFMRTSMFAPISVPSVAAFLPGEPAARW